MWCQSHFSGNNTGRRRSSRHLRTLHFAVAGVVFVRTNTSPDGPPDAVCSAWMTAATHRPARRTPERPTKSLWNAKDDDNTSLPSPTSWEKNYSPFRASWKTPKVEAAPKKKFEAPKLNLPDFSKFEAPNMSVDLPKIEMSMPRMPKVDAPNLSMPEFTTFAKLPERGQGKRTPAQGAHKQKTNYSPLQASWKTTTPVAAPTAANGKQSYSKLGLPKIPTMGKPNIPSIPEFTIPKLEAPQLPKFPKFPDRGQGRAKPPGGSNTNRRSNSDDTRPNYSRLRASWKGKSPAPATLFNGNHFSAKSDAAIILPDLSSLGLPKHIKFKQYSDEVQNLSLNIDKSIKDKVSAFTGKTDYQVGDISKAIIAKVANEEFDLAEVTFFFRILIALGADLSGFSAVLPVSGLVGVFGWSISMGLAERVTQFISVEIHKRLNDNDADLRDATPAAGAPGALPSPSLQLPYSSTGKASLVQQYNPGDLTKSALLDYTRKPSYAVGDLAGKGGGNGGGNLDVNARVLQELEECLSIEKALIEKLARVQQQQA